MDYCLDRLFGIWGEVKIVEMISLQVGFHGSIVRHFFFIIQAPYCDVWNSYSPFTWSFKALWSRMRFVVEVCGFLGVDSMEQVFLKKILVARLVKKSPPSMKPNIHYHVHKSPPLNSVLSN
jgi:hypothetical protein